MVYGYQTSIRLYASEQSLVSPLAMPPFIVEFASKISVKQSRFPCWRDLCKCPLKVSDLHQPCHPEKRLTNIHLPRHEGFIFLHQLSFRRCQTVSPHEEALHFFNQCQPENSTSKCLLQAG